MSNPHVTSYIWTRGFRYTAVSACAVVAGYLMQAPKTTLFRLEVPSLNLNDFLVLLIPITTSGFFFICYMTTFYPPKVSTEIQNAFEKEAVWTFPYIEIPILLVIVLALALRGGLSIRLLTAFGIYGVLYFAYGVYLTKYKQTGPLPLVRHQLVWPVLLSVGLGLYYGLSFSLMRDSWMPIVPVCSVVSVYSLSGLIRSSKKAFLLRTLLTMLAVTIIVILVEAKFRIVPTILTDSFLTMLFCIAVSAYLAVFESWFITAHIADIENRPNQNVPSSEEQKKSTQYGIATLWALVVSVWILPFYFIYSAYGTWFLVGFLVHAFVAFVFWSYFGKDQFLMSFPWHRIKVIVGLLFLGLLVAVTFSKQQFPFSAMTGFASIEGLSLAAIAGGWVGYTFLKSVGRIKNKRSALFPVRILLGKNRINSLRLLCVLCLVMCFIIYGLLHSSFEGDRHERAELAFDVYWLCLLISSLINLLISSRLLPKMSLLVNAVLGFLISIRILTSVAIALIIVLPATLKGFPILTGIAMALPFFLAACGGFALNDYFDIEKDRINKPYRAIPSGKLHPRSVLHIGLGLLLLAIASGLAVSTTKMQLFLYSVAILGVGFYNVFVKYLTPTKNVLTASISALPVLYVVTMFEYPRVYLLVPIASCLFLLGREWLMDIRDLPGDLSSGSKTLPSIFSVRAVETGSFYLLLVSALVLVPLAVTTSSFWTAALISLIGGFVSLISMVWHFGPSKYRRAAVLSLWFPMACGILILAT